MMDARVYVQGLRDFADFVEQHPNVATWGGNLPVLRYCLTRHEFEQAYATIGDELPVEVGDQYAEVHRRFGPISVEMYTEREKVCEPVETVEAVVTTWRYQPATEEGPEPESGMPDGYLDGTAVYSEHDRRL